MNGALWPLWVVGGEQKRTLLDQNEWNRFRAAVVARVDPETGGMEKVLEYRTPPERCPDDQPSHIFKAATVDGGAYWTIQRTVMLLGGAR